MASTAVPADCWLTQTNKPLQQAGTLILIGHAGRSFWEALNPMPKTVNPIDDYSTQQTQKILRQHLPNTQCIALFPQDQCPINLIQLAQHMGWYTQSTLGMGIHQQYGLWSALRALWWLDLDSKQCRFSPPTDLCNNCLTQECITTCPAQALDLEHPPDLHACANYRFSTNSLCQQTCLSRYACPVGSHERYSSAQMAHHYDLSRSGLKAFLNK